MCSFFDNNANSLELDRRFELSAPPTLANRQHVRPTDLALIIESGRRARLSPWGLAAPWRQGSPHTRGQPIINARAETLAEKKTFRPLLEHRCLVPATAWYEWRKAGGMKLKNKISLPQSPLFAFAGLTDGENFSLVTCPPAPGIAHIHDRMPVVLDGPTEAAWLDADQPFAAVARSLTSYLAGPLLSEEEQPVQPDFFV